MARSRRGRDQKRGGVARGAPGPWAESDGAARAPRAQRAVLNCIDYLSRFGYTREQVPVPARWRENRVDLGRLLVLLLAHNAVLLKSK